MIIRNVTIDHTISDNMIIGHTISDNTISDHTISGHMNIRNTLVLYREERATPICDIKQVAIALGIHL